MNVFTRRSSRSKGKEIAESSNSKGKGKTNSGSISTALVIRTTPPKSPPRPRAVVPAPRRGVTHFPFKQVPQFPDDISKERYERFQSYEVLSSLFPDVPTCEELSELNDIVETLEECNLGYLCEEDPGTFPRLVIEFMASFKVIWEGEEQNDAIGNAEDDDDMDVDGSCALKWRFQLGNQEYTLQRQDIMRILDCDMDAESVSTRGRDRDEFWSILTGQESYFLSGMPSAAIVSPRWKVIHRLIAMNLNIRLDGGRLVNNRDLDAMRAIHEGKGLDVMSILSRQFLSYQNVGCKARALGGGAVITRIAKDLGFNLIKGTSLAKKTLTKDMMENMKMLSIMPFKWKVRTDIPERIQKRLRARMRKDEYIYAQRDRVPPPRERIPSPIEQTPPPAAHTFPSQTGQPGGFSFDMLMGRMDSITSLSKRSQKIKKN